MCGKDKVERCGATKYGKPPKKNHRACSRFASNHVQQEGAGYKYDIHKAQSQLNQKTLFLPNPTRRGELVPAQTNPGDVGPAPQPTPRERTNPPAQPNPTWSTLVPAQTNKTQVRRLVLGEVVGPTQLITNAPIFTPSRSFQTAANATPPETGPIPRGMGKKTWGPSVSFRATAIRTHYPKPNTR